MAGNGKKIRAGVHAHESKMHPGKPKTRMPVSVMKKNGKKDNKDDRKRY